MSEQLTTTNPNLPASEVGDQISGYEAVHPEVKPFYVKKLTYETNLPSDVNIFEFDMDDPYLRGTILPRQLEKLPVGQFWIKGNYTDPFDISPDSQTIKREINILDSPKGKVVDIKSMGLVQWAFTGGEDATKLMESIGYITKESNGKHEIAAIPTPETVKACAKEQGVEVELFDNQEWIDGKDYLNTFAQGKYPVSTANETVYQHDISDDHITAMVLGGDVLRDALKTVAIEALKGDKDHIDKIASAVDRFTATLRAILSHHEMFSDEAYSADIGRKNLMSYADTLGMPAENVDKIISSAQAKARQFGLNVKELN